MLDIDLYGDWKSDTEYSVLEIMLLPCATRFTAYDGTVHGGGENCVWDKNETLAYLGDAININLLFN